MTRVVIRKLRILGLAGRPPTRLEIETTARRALAGPAASVANDAPLRIDGGRTLDDAAGALAAALGARKGGRV